jgi:serine/threonine-protein kinase
MAPLPALAPPSALLRQINSLADRFQAGLEAGSPPDVESFLEQVEREGRPELLRELLRLESDHRQKQGRPLTAAEARQRFSRLGDWVDPVLDGLGLEDTADFLTLNIIDGPQAGLSFQLAGHARCVVGRGPNGVDLAVESDPHLSRVHFLVEYNTPRACLADQGSKSGTFLNDKKIERVELLGHGDEIRAGRTRFKVKLPPGQQTVTLEHPADASQPKTLLPSSDLAADLRIDAVCVRFERAWQSGSRPRLEDFLEQVAADERHALLLHLLPLEVEYRVRRGEKPTRTEYRGRYPHAAKLVEELIPATIPGYQTLKELGRGAMGVVYQARRYKDDHVVALKMIAPAVAPNPVAVAKFKREICILRNLTHPHIVSFHDADEADGLLYFVMECVDGDSASWLVKQRGPFPPDRVVALGCQLLDALAHAHLQGFVHRDVKPGNVLITSSDGGEMLKLADFGLGRAYQASAMSGLTLDGTSGGTPAYMPPEQVLDFRAARPAADQYAAAATLYFLLTGQTVYEPAPSPMELLRRILDSAPLPLRNPPEGPPLPPKLGDVLRRALARDPRQRFPDVVCMRNALAKAL